MEPEVPTPLIEPDRPGAAGPASAAPGPEALLEAIIDTSPDGLITIDAEATIRSFNPAAERLFGYGADEVVGRNVSTLMPEPYASRHDGYLRHYLETGERRIIGIGREVAGLRKNGETFPMELAVGEVRFMGASLFAGFVRDISQRKEAAERLAELRAELIHVSRLSAMGEMASVLAHELNQPLTAVANYAQAARRLHGTEAADRGRIQELLEKAVQQAGRAGQIIHRLRQFLAKGETERRLEPVNQLIREASDLALVGAASQGIEVRFDLAQGLPPILIDRIQIHQVVTNLIRNSVDALVAAPRREIALESSLRGDEVEVRVADTGPGLTPEIRARLFEPFVTTKATGMGIGLSICRSIVDAHQGRIWASDKPGGGTVFHLALPLPAGGSEGHAG
jgi:two-component system sensor kinase FixL